MVCNNETMKEKYNLTQKVEAVMAGVLIALGLACLLFPKISADGLMISLCVLCTISGAVLVGQAIDHKRGMDWFKAIAVVILAFVLWMYRLEGLAFVSNVFAFYMAATAIILLIQGIVDAREGAAGVGAMDMLLAAGGFGLAGFAWYANAHHMNVIQELIGGYLLYQGLQLLIEMLIFRSHHSSRRWSFRYWSSLPVYIVAAGPSLLLRYAEKHHIENQAFPKTDYKNDKPVNLRVYIHTGLTGDHQFGHMTFSYKDVMFSYGNYDLASEKLFRSYGPGILFTTPAEIYVNNCCLVEDSTLFEFGLHLDEKQETRLKHLLESIFEQTYRWYCPLSQEPLSEERFEKLEKDYSCRLFWRTGAKFYKFRRGQWKNYWVFGTNCSLFSSYVLHTVDDDIAIPHGINTPGEYFEYFSEAFQDPDSNVVFRSWHNPDDPQTLFPAAI